MKLRVKKSSLAYSLVKLLPDLCLHACKRASTKMGEVETSACHLYIISLKTERSTRTSEERKHSTDFQQCVITKRSVKKRTPSQLLQNYTHLQI